MEGSRRVLISGTIRILCGWFEVRHEKPQESQCSVEHFNLSFEVLSSDDCEHFPVDVTPFRIVVASHLLFE